MSWSLQRARFVVFSVVVLLGQPPLIQPALAQKVREGGLGKGRDVRDIEIDDPKVKVDPKTDTGLGGSEHGALTLNRDSGLKRKLEATIQLVENENWKLALESLQSLVEMDPGRDVFAELPRTSGGRTSYVSVSVQTEADRLIGNLPPDVKKIYKTTYSGKANELFRQARDEQSLDKLQAVIRQYRHTDAGLQAATIWATHVLDRGRYSDAAREFENLLDGEGWDKATPLTLFKAAYAFRQAANQMGDSSRTGLLAKEEKVWETLRERKIKELSLDGSMRNMDDLKEYVAKLPAEAAPKNQTEHSLVGVSPSRGGQGIGGPAYLEKKWSQGMSRGGPKAPGGLKLNQAITSLQSRGQPILASFQPVALTVTLKGEKVPLVVFRSHWGLHGVNMKNGKTVWESQSSWGLDRLASDAKFGRTQALENWSTFYFTQVDKPSMFLENSTIATLSTDGNLVFAVEDLEVPPRPQIQYDDPWGRPNQNLINYHEELKKAMNHNRLMAISAGSGNLRWELGGPNDKHGLNDTYFLGPPLPYEGKLYVMCEKAKKLRLLCLETFKYKSERDPDRELDGVRVVSSQPLGDAKYPMAEDSIRRSQVCHLSCADGILVCPTNAGALLAFNLRTNRLVWAYFYREKSDGPEEWNPGMGRGRVLPKGWEMMPDGTARPMMVNTTQQWKVTPPVIQDGKVVYTPPDGRTISCLDLKTGTRLWSHYRGEDDLFLGGIVDNKVLIVGKKNVMGRDLKTGDPVFKIAAGSPSGMGIASDNVFYLPMKESVETREPGIAAIDVNKGILLGTTRARNKTDNTLDVPGNLIFFDNSVLAQSATAVFAYPQLKAKLAEIDDLVAKNPEDMNQLYDRGLLRLERGDMLGSVEDLRKVLAKKPGKELEDKTRDKLYVTLTEFMLRDFERAEVYLKEYEELCKLDIDSKPIAEQDAAKAEERRRRVKFLCLVARGKEQQGKLVDAFERYSECGSIVDTKELFSVPDEPTVKAAPDVLSQGRIAAMIANATPEARKPLEDRISKKWEELKKSNDLSELRKFVAVFGSTFPVGKEARLQLAEKLMDDEASTSLIEAERHLSLLRGRDEIPELKARAIEGLARLCARKGLMEDAMYFYRLLARDYPKLQIRDGKTGAELLNEKGMQKPFLPYLEEPTRVHRIGRVNSGQNQPGVANNNLTYTFDLNGEPLPYFKRHSIGVTLNYQNQLRVLDRLSGEVYWETPLKQTMFANLQAGPSDAPKYPYQTMGHLVVLPVANFVFGIDPVNKKVLWSTDLGPATGVSVSQLVRDLDGSIQVVYNDGYKQRLGSTGPLDGNAICLQTREGLVALDPVSGRTLWTRADVGPRNHLFGDEKTIYVVEMDSAGVAISTKTLRAYDGVTVKRKDFSARYHNRLSQEGSTLVHAETVGPRTNVGVYDLETGKDVWTYSFTGGTLLKSQDPDLVGAIESGGRLKVVSLSQRKVVLSTAVDGLARAVVDAKTIHLLKDANYYYVAINGPADPEVPINPQYNLHGVQPNVMTNVGMRCIPVHGKVYCFDNMGKQLWWDEVFNEMLVLEQFHDMPIILFTSRYGQGNPLRGTNVTYKTVAKAREKRTGRLVYDNDVSGSNFNDAQNFYALTVDAANRRIDFVSPNRKISFPYDLPKTEEKK